MKLFICLSLLLIVSEIQSQVPECSFDSTGFIPLNDLGEGYFEGYQGGLYPGGSNNIPIAHFKAGKKLAKQIKPLNSSGAMDEVNGKVVLLCLGSSTAGYTFDKFTELYQDTTTINPCLIFANGSYGSRGLETMVDADDEEYWGHVFSALDSSGVTQEQVQIIWLKNVSRMDTVIEFPEQPLAIKDKFKTLAQIVKDKFPNTKLLYLTGEHYGGYVPDSSYKHEILGEPVSYYNNWAVKWAIEDQINGDINLSYSAPLENAPWMAWAHYAWADGINERITDGLNWLCPDDFTLSGGYHLSDTGKIKEAQLLYQYFSINTISKVWFLNGPKWTSCADIDRYRNEADAEMKIFPNPNQGIFSLQLNEPEQEEVSICIYDYIGNIVYEKNCFLQDNLVLMQLEMLPTGIYLCVIANNLKQTKSAFIIE